MKPGYKQTEVGVIPEEWGTHRLGQLLQDSRSIRYGIVQPGKFESTGCFMLRSQDYSKGWAGPDGMHKVSAQLEHQYRNAKIICNDLVITVVGAGIGQVVVVPDWLTGAVLSRSTARIAIDEDKAARSFVRAFLEGPLGKRQILDCQKEGAQPVVSCLDLAKFFVAYPPLPEQRAIATALSDVDALLAALDRLLAKKRDLKQAAMQQLLTGQTRLPGFAGEWEVKRLGDLGEVTGAGVDKKVRPGEQTVRLVNYMDAYKRDFIASDDLWHEVSAGPDQARRCAVEVGDVFFTPTSEVRDDIGHSAVAVEDIPDAAYSYHLVRLRIRVPWDVRFRAYAFKTKHFTDQATMLCEGSGTRYVITLPKFRSMTVCIPSDPAEQTAIAAVLSDMDAELAALEQRRDKTRALKQGMMQELLTGRTRLLTSVAGGQSTDEI